MCQRCRAHLRRIIEVPHPYRASPGSTGNTGGRYTTKDRLNEATEDTSIDYIQSILGEKECKRLIKQAYRDIKNNNLSLKE
jgi:hypothetical protein